MNAYAEFQTIIMSKTNTATAARPRQEARQQLRHVECVILRSHQYSQHFTHVSWLARLLVVYSFASLMLERGRGLSLWLYSVETVIIAAIHHGRNNHDFCLLRKSHKQSEYQIIVKVLFNVWILNTIRIMNITFIYFLSYAMLSHSSDTQLVLSSTDQMVLIGLYSLFLSSPCCSVNLLELS